MLSLSSGSVTARNFDKSSGKSSPEQYLANRNRTRQISRERLLRPRRLTDQEYSCMLTNDRSLSLIYHILSAPDSSRR